MSEQWSAVWDRIQPGGTPAPSTSALLVVVAVAAVVVLLPRAWRTARVLVTVVHELGHAVVGVLCGRRFTGLVLRPDMSGHTVTVGASRGVGRVLTTWAGYPAPGVLGAVLVQLGSQGWGAPLLGVGALVLALGLLRARSLYTVLVMVTAAAVTGALWWWAPADVQALVLVATGVFLLVGAWRHLGAVAAGGRAGSDPAVLARLTHLPAVLWTLSFAAVLAAATWWAVLPVAGLLRL